MKLITKIEKMVNSRYLAYFIMFFAFALLGVWLEGFATAWLAEQGILDSTLFGFPLEWGTAVGVGLIGALGLLIGKQEGR